MAGQATLRRALGEEKFCLFNLFSGFDALVRWLAALLTKNFRVFSFESEGGKSVIEQLAFIEPVEVVTRVTPLFPHRGAKLIAMLIFVAVHTIRVIRFREFEHPR